ncbi:MAG: hypothetical protein ACYSWR_05740 [Planctomycetota bacterium]|jgi:hypothetical protein
MPKEQGQNREKTLLVFNCHEPWVYQLGVLGYNLDIINGLKGRFKESWDEQLRPVPANSRLVSLSEVHSTQKPYYCIIAHNITDLLDVKLLTGPRLIVLHSTIEGREAEERSDITPEKMKEALHKYLGLVGGHAVAISALKGKSWDFTEDIVPCGIDVVRGRYPAVFVSAILLRTAGRFCYGTFTKWHLRASRCGLSGTIRICRELKLPRTGSN